MLVCHQFDVCKKYVGSVYVGGYGGLTESGLCVFRELSPVSFLEHLKFCVVCIDGRRYVCCSECNVVSN